MKRRPTSRISLKTKTTANRYLVAAVSLSVIISLCALVLFYFPNIDDAMAGGKHPHRPSKTLGVFEKQVTCKPKNGYQKGKLSKSNGDSKASNSAYKYVYASASAAPPRSSKSFAPVGGTTSREDELKSPVAKATTYSSWVNLSTEEREKAIKSMTPSGELPPIRFITDKDEFSVVNMDLIMEALEHVNQGKLILVEGHTDDVGSNSYNLNLSMKRVEKIKELLLQAGADSNLISLAGYGEAKPLVPNTNDENRQINRRIEIKVFDLQEKLSLK